MNDFFVEFEKEGIQPNHIIKMKTDQNSIRKMTLRIDTIRDTEFVRSTYAIVQVMGLLMAFGLLIFEISTFHLSCFLLCLSTS